MQRTLLLGCCLCTLLLLSLSGVSAQSPPEALQDGVPSYILPTIQTNYFTFHVCSKAAADAERDDADPAPDASDAPVNLAWTNLTNLTPSNPYSALNPFAAEIFVSFTVADPSPSNYAFRSRTGMLIVPADSFRGCTMYLSVVIPDIAYMNGTTQYGILAQQHELIQLTECVPQRWASQSPEANATQAQFTLQSQATQGSSQTVAFNAATISTPSQFTLWVGTRQPLTKDSAQWQLGPNEQQVLYQNDPNWPADGVFFLSIEAETTQPFVLITNGNAGWCSTDLRGEGGKERKLQIGDSKQAKQLGNDPNNPALLTDGGVFVFPTMSPDANGFFYLDLKLHSYLAEVLSLAAGAGLQRPEIPPLVCAFTDLSDDSSSSRDQAAPPAIWGSWGWNAPNNNSFDVSSQTGVLVVSNDTVVGQYQLNLALQWNASQVQEAFSFGCSIFNALQVTAGPPQGQPQDWQSVWMESGGSVALQQFVTTIPSTLQTCTITVSLPIGGDAGVLSLFLSTAPNPSASSNQWSSDSGLLRIAPSDPGYPQGTLYIAVGANNWDTQDVSYQLRVDLACSNDDADEKEKEPALVERIALD